MRNGWWVIGLALMISGCASGVISESCNNSVCATPASGRQVFQTYFLPRSEIDVSFTPAKSGNRGALVIGARTIPDPAARFQIQYRRNHLATDKFNLTVVDGLLNTSNATSQVQTESAFTLAADLREALEPDAPAAAPAPPSYTLDELNAIREAFASLAFVDPTNTGQPLVVPGVPGGSGTRTPSSTQRTRVVAVAGHNTCSMPETENLTCRVLVGFRYVEHRIPCTTTPPSTAINVSACAGGARTYFETNGAATIWAVIDGRTATTDYAALWPGASRTAEPGQSVYFRIEQPRRLTAALQLCSYSANYTPSSWTGCNPYNSPAEFDMDRREFLIQAINQNQTFALDLPRGLTGDAITNLTFDDGVLKSVDITRPGAVAQTLRYPLALIGILELSDD